MGTRRAQGWGAVVVAAVMVLGADVRAANAAGCDVPEARSHVDAAEVHLAAGRYREAISEFNRAILAAPECDRAKQGVIEANRALVTRRTSGGETENSLNHHISLGGAAFDAGDYDRAIEEWEAALAIDPENRVAASLIQAAKEAKVDLLIEEGSQRFAAGDTQGAIAAWEQGQKLDPFNATLKELLREGRQQGYRDTEAELDNQLQDSMARIRAELERSRMLPDDVNGRGSKYRDYSEMPELGSFRAPGGSGVILKELRNPVSVDFEETNLRAVLRFLSEITGINFLIDESVFDEVGEPDPDDEDAEPRILVTIFVNELPLESALKGMLRQHGLDFSIQRDFIYISTPSVLRASSFEQLEVRFYRLRDAARLSLPKVYLQASTTTGAQVGDVQTVDIGSGGEVVDRVDEVPDELQDAPNDPTQYSVARLLAILRNFVPAVIEPPSQVGAGQRQQAASQQRAAADTIVGGWGRVRGTQPVPELESLPRERVFDANTREVLSRLDYDVASHTIIAKNTASNLDLMEQMLDRLDQPTGQVNVEARFLTVGMTDLHRVNMDLSLAFSSSIGGLNVTNASQSQLYVDQTLFGGLATPGLPTVNDRGFFNTLGLSANDFTTEAAIDLLTQLDNTEIISAPRVTTLSGKPAIIQDVNTQIFLTDLQTSVTTVQVPNADPVTFEEIDPDFTAVTSGVTLTVTPQVLDRTQVRLVLLPDVSSITDVDQVDINSSLQEGVVVGTLQLPRQSRQSLYTNCLVNSGETLILGGLIRNEANFQERSVPFLRDVPWIGNFFRSTGERVQRRQLLIFIRTEVIDPDGYSFVRLN